MIVWPAKDPAEVLDYTWTVPLDGSDTIASFTASVSSGTVAIDSSNNTAAQVLLWLSGGADTETTTISLSATTVGGRTFREVAILPVYDRASEMLALFRVRYPAFSAIDDGVVGYWLGDAGLTVGTEWPDDARDPAKLALAAHTIESLGLRSGQSVMEGVSSFKSGTFSATFSSAAADRTGLEATIYGREFLRLRRASFSGVMSAWSTAACGPGYIPGACDV